MTSVRTSDAVMSSSSSQFHHHHNHHHRHQQPDRSSAAPGRGGGDDPARFRSEIFVPVQQGGVNSSSHQTPSSWQTVHERLDQRRKQWDDEVRCLPCNSICHKVLSSVLSVLFICIYSPLWRTNLFINRKSVRLFASMHACPLKTFLFTAELQN